MPPSESWVRTAVIESMCGQRLDDLRLSCEKPFLAITGSLYCLHFLGVCLQLSGVQKKPTRTDLLSSDGSARIPSLRWLLLLS